jgi:hypothetical protein
MPTLTIQTAASQLLASYTPQELFAAMLAEQSAASQNQSIAQFPSSLPSDASASLSANWLLAFAAYCDGAEPSSDYASAAALVRDSITDIATNGVSTGRLVALLRGLGLLYRRVMKATPHLRNQA